MERHATPSTRAETIRLHALAQRFDVRRGEAAKGRRIGDLLAVRDTERPSGAIVAGTALRIGETVICARGFMVALAGHFHALDPVVERDGRDLTTDLAGNGGWWSLYPDPRAALEWSNDHEPSELAFN